MTKGQNSVKSELVTPFEEVSAIFAANNVDVTDSIMKLMTPLINNSLNFDEHRAYLKAKLHRLQE